MAEFEDTYNAYFKDVYLYIYSMSGDQHLAEDITAETFIKAMKAIDSFKGNCDIRVWLCQIAKNSYFSYLRKNRKFVDLEKLPERADEHDVAEMIAAAEASMKIHEVLHNLNEPYKEVFTLRVFGELSFKQIANLFGKSENWACVTYHRARKK
ncbi:MAG: sigma-70 family RNA polymerase sigma factor, partial [Firmicutes bacterium]|nr:sigma-70 family RNA polymerase sigma factor [Bacillota bacterium]